MEKTGVEKQILRKVGEALGRFRMIRDSDHVAVGVSGGKDSLSLVLALDLLQKRAPIDFSLTAFTVEQGKFLASIQPVGDWLLNHGIKWICVEDKPSLRLLTEQPGHGCDICSRFRRRAVYEIGKVLGANVIALGHTSDDFCESFLRNAMFNGRISALPPITWSRQRDFRLIRPLVYVGEDLTRDYTATLDVPVIPCGCSQKTGTVRRGLRDILAELEGEHPRIKETLLAAMGRLDTQRLLDTRYLDLDGNTADGESIDSEALVNLLPA